MAEEGAKRAQLERLVEAVGAFGPFQAVLAALVYLPLAMVAWSMLLPSFGAVVPDWWCVPPDVTDNATFRTNLTFKLCPQNSSVQCVRVYAEDKVTIISQFDLECDRKWIASTTTMVQMAGVLLGALAGGQAADLLGRKTVNYATFLVHTVLNVIAAFSLNWEMYAAVRFFIGLMIGGFVVVNYLLPLEFVGRKWRPVLPAVPSWTMGVALMALCAWLLQDIRHLHLTGAALSAPLLLGWFVVPESMRWLAVHGRLEEAERAVDKMARFNRRTKPSDTRQQLALVAQEEKAASAKARFYSYHYLIRNWSIAKTTFINLYIWFSCSLVYYAIAFGVQNLSFNLYLNIFIMAVVEIPPAITTFFLARSIGRRWTAAGYFFLSSLSALVVVICDRTAPEDVRGTLMNGFAIVAKLGLGAGWGTMLTLTNELYPTVVRSLAGGACNTASRVSGILAPLVLFFSDDAVFVPYVVVCGVMVTSGLLALCLKETRDIPLADTLVKSPSSLASSAGKQAPQESVEEDSEDFAPAKESDKLKTVA